MTFSATHLLAWENSPSTLFFYIIHSLQVCYALSNAIVLKVIFSMSWRLNGFGISSNDPALPAPRTISVWPRISPGVRVQTAFLVLNERFGATRTWEPGSSSADTSGLASHRWVSARIQRFPHKLSNVGIWRRTELSSLHLLSYYHGLVSMHQFTYGIGGLVHTLQSFTLPDNSSKPLVGKKPQLPS